MGFHIHSYVLTHSVPKVQQSVELLIEIFNGCTNNTKTYLHLHKCHNVCHLKMELALNNSFACVHLSTVST